MKTALTIAGSDAVKIGMLSSPDAMAATAEWLHYYRPANIVITIIAHSLDIGTGCGPTHHFWQLYQNGLQKETEADNEP